MSPSQYHQRYTGYSEEEIQKRAAEKESEVAQIFEKVRFYMGADPVRLAVLGCGDKRFASYHQKLFEKFLNNPVDMTTFDISVDHLGGIENVIRHDCTLPLPNVPYDITYAHVLLKFIETQKQWDLIMNSYNALAPNGLAIHIFDKSDYETTSTKQTDGYYSVPLERWKRQLNEKGVEFLEIPVKHGKALVLIR